MLVDIMHNALPFASIFPITIHMKLSLVLTLCAIVVCTFVSGVQLDMEICLSRQFITIIAQCSSYYWNKLRGVY